MLAVATDDGAGRRTSEQARGSLEGGGNFLADHQTGLVFGAILLFRKLLEAKTNDLDDEAVCIVRTVKDGTGHKFLHLKPGRYVLSFEATFGDDVKVRLSEDRLTPSP